MTEGATPTPTPTPTTAVTGSPTTTTTISVTETTATDSPYRHTARLVLTSSASDEFVYDFNNLGVVKKCPTCPHRYYDYRTPKEQCVSCGNRLIVVRVYRSSERLFEP